jgi:multisubunit Na+/H+ antiporter MnhE subunit
MMSTNFIILIAELIFVWLIFQTLIKLFNTVFSYSVTILVIIIILMFFGFLPQDFIQKTINLFY